MSHFEILHKAVHSTKGEIWECGVFRGDTAEQLAITAPGRTLRLFDTFTGMPVSGPHDIHEVGSFSNTSEVFVREKMAPYLGVRFHVGRMPETFAGLEDSQIGVINIDVDQYESVRACLEFAYPRVAQGGYIVLDDYNCKNCPGAKKAVDEFMMGKPEVLLTSEDNNNPQAYFIKA